MQDDKLSKYGARIAWVLFFIGAISAIYVMYNNLGLIEGMDWGPGAYYYTDIPGWEKIFWPEGHITCNTDYPVIFAIAFVAWGAFLWKAFLWLDKKL